MLVKCECRVQNANASAERVRVQTLEMHILSASAVGAMRVLTVSAECGMLMQVQSE